MPLRRFVLLFWLCLAAFACENEPYQYPPLGVTSLTNHVSNQTNTYSYRKQHLYTYRSGIGTNVSTSMKFTYALDELLYIVRDSTATSRNVTTFYREGNVVKDTTVLVQGIFGKVVGARAVTYDTEGNPVLINKKEWTDAGITEEEAELVWEDQNVVKLTTYTIASGERTLVNEVTIGYDDKSCIYMHDPGYLYTMPFKDLFWLSRNNPIVFTDESGEKQYRYSYNRLGYPSVFRNEVGTLFGVNYTQVR